MRSRHSPRWFAPARFLACGASLAVLAGLLLACSTPGSGARATPLAAATHPPLPAPASAITATLPSLSPLPERTPASERVRVQTANSSQTYAVYGTTAEEIFSYIDAYGPLNDKGERGSGLTEVKWSLQWDSNRDQRACTIATMTIHLDLKVTLPALDRAERLPLALRAGWDGFAAAVAAHEQRHVDIAVRGASTLKGKMEAITPRSPCSALETEVANVWSAQQQQTDGEQARFHADEQARIGALRDPLRAQIDANRTKIDGQRTQIAALDSNIRDLSGQIEVLSANLNSLKSQLASIESQYQGQTLPPSVNQLYESLRQQYNGLIPAYNALVDNYNSTLNRRNALTTENETLRTATNDLVDRFNWTR